MYGLDDNQFKSLLGELMPEQSAVTPQAAQLTQGLLGSSDGQNQKLRNLISNGLNAAEQLGQNAMAQAQNSLEEQQMSNQQAIEQAAARYRQQQQAAGSLLGKLISTFIPDGSVLGFLRPAIKSQEVEAGT